MALRLSKLREMPRVSKAHHRSPFAKGKEKILFLVSG